MVRSSILFGDLNILRKIKVKSIIKLMLALCSATRSKVAILKIPAVERKNKKRLVSKVSF